MPEVVLERERVADAGAELARRPLVEHDRRRARAPPASEQVASAASDRRHARSSTAATSEYGTAAVADAHLVREVDEDAEAAKPAAAAAASCVAATTASPSERVVALERPGAAGLDQRAGAGRGPRAWRCARGRRAIPAASVAAASIRLTRPAWPKRRWSVASGTKSARAASCCGRERELAERGGRLHALDARAAARAPGSSRRPKSVLPGIACAASARTSSVPPATAPSSCRERRAHERLAPAEGRRRLLVEAPESLVDAVHARPARRGGPRPARSRPRAATAPARSGGRAPASRSARDAGKGRAPNTAASVRPRRSRASARRLSRTECPTSKAPASTATATRHAEHDGDVRAAVVDEAAAGRASARASGGLEAAVRSCAGARAAARRARRCGSRARARSAPRGAARGSRSATFRAESRSRLPVGSSHSSSCGRITSARASAVRCRSPPDSSRGPVLEALAEADPLEQRARPRRVVAGRGRHQRRGQHVLEHAHCGSRKWSWNTKPIPGCGRPRARAPGARGRHALRRARVPRSAARASRGCRAACSCRCRRGR